MILKTHNDSQGVGKKWWGGLSAEIVAIWSSSYSSSLLEINTKSSKTNYRVLGFHKGVLRCDGGWGGLTLALISFKYRTQIMVCLSKRPCVVSHMCSRREHQNDAHFWTFTSRRDRHPSCCELGETPKLTQWNEYLEWVLKLYIQVNLLKYVF